MDETEYAKNLYQEKNIIGYTGDLNNKPTVYFKNGNQHGQITQGHSVKDNIGREIGISSSDYKTKKSLFKKRHKEYVGNELIHESRNRFVEVLDNDVRKELAKAIDKFKYIKPYSTKTLNNVKKWAKSNTVFIDDNYHQAATQFQTDLNNERQASIATNRAMSQASISSITAPGYAMRGGGSGGHQIQRPQPKSQPKPNQPKYRR